MAEDDDRKGVGWDMIELLLKGAVGTLSGCRLLANSQCKRRLRQPFQARLSSEQSIVAACPSPTPYHSCEPHLLNPVSVASLLYPSDAPDELLS